MDKKYKSLRDFIQHPKKKEILFNLIMERLKKELKELIEEIALEEREIFCEEKEDVGNRYYTRDLKTSNWRDRRDKNTKNKQEKFRGVCQEFNVNLP